MHILHIFLHIQCIFVCIFICIFCIFYRCIVRIFCILYTTYCAYCAYSGSKKPFSGFSLFIATTAWSPIPGPSCSRTTTYNHHRRLLIYRRKLRESLLHLDAWQRVLSLQHPLEQEEGVPVWRTLESHTKLVLVHGIRRLFWIGTELARLKWKNKLEYAKYAKYAEYHLVFFGPCTLPALKHRHSRGTACQCPSLYVF